MYNVQIEVSFIFKYFPVSWISSSVQEGELLNKHVKAGFLSLDTADILIILRRLGVPSSLWPLPT